MVPWFQIFYIWNIINILQEEKELDQELFNMGIRMLARWQNKNTTSWILNLL